MDPDLARARLLEEKRALVGVEQDLTATFDNMVAAAKDSNLDDEHDPEGSTIAAERSLVASLGRQAIERLREVETALARVDHGTYGTCLGCGGEIGDGRLEARPAATHCITCASQSRRR